MPLTEGSAPKPAPDRPYRAPASRGGSADQMYAFALAVTRLKYVAGDLADVLKTSIDADRKAKAARAAKADVARKLRAAQVAQAVALADSQVRAERGMGEKL